ncbi:fucose permease [Microbacterium sp. AG1240]|nr:fucose permease [Microbacterium sp. AG1240]
MGATASSVPAVLPTAQSQLGEGVLAAAPLLFLGLLAGVCVSALLPPSVDVTRVVLTGTMLQTAGLALGAFSWSPAVFIAAAGLAGVGFGLTESAIGVVAKMTAEQSAARTLTGLTTTVALAACLCPLALGAATLAAPGSIVALLLPAAVNALAVPALLRLRARVRAGAPAPRARLSVTAPLVALAAAIAVYVGIESVISGWSSAIPFELLDIDPSSAVLGTSIFWALMAIGRACAAGMLRAGSTPRLTLTSGSTLAAAALVMAAVTVDRAPAVALVCLAIAVVALAPTYGIVLGTALDRTDDRGAPRVSAAIIACGAGGGALLPLGVLAVGQEPGSALTFVTLAGACVVVLTLVLVGSATSIPRSRRQRHG